MDAPRRKDSGMPPIRKDSVVLPGAGPTRRATLAPRNANQERVMSGLNTAIQTINLVKDLVPIQLAKGVLSSVAGILGIVKTAIANQSDFQELVEQCQTIGLVVWRATSETPEHKIDDHVRRALSELQKSVDGIRDAVEAKTRKSIGSKVFNVTVNQDTITKWKAELDRILNLFNTELSISTNLKLDELLASFREFRSTVTFNLQVDVQQVPEVLPVRPKVFVGRDELVQSTAKSLLECRDVALIGPGGMGKTSIARAVLNDHALASKFEDNRFFVRFDDMDASQVTLGTFLDRIAKALGLATSANIFNSITKALSASQTLLVLDNAETFLDAAADAGRIADVIDGFGARSNIAMLLTTRTTVLPPNLEWVRFRVPALEEDAACMAFKLYYTPSIENSTLIRLLSAVDFHPLSINLLAQAAVQNDWTSQDLVAAWDRQRAVLLDGGEGKIQSIAVTIETSLNSPSLLKLGDTARHLLQIMAFLPQGISKQRLTAIFPVVDNIESCADVLCKQSLAYLSGDFITLLAPIRLYISKRYNVNILKNPLLDKVRRYYAAHNEDDEVISQEDVNVEHVLSHWVVEPDAMSDVLDLICDFIYSLLDCRPRPLSLRPIISGLDPGNANFSPSCTNFLQAFPGSPKHKPYLDKAMCLFAISTITRWIGQIEEAENILEEARGLMLESGRFGRLRLLFVDWGVGMIYVEQGNYKAAEELYRSALKRSSAMFMPNKGLNALIRFGMSSVDAAKGIPGASKGALDAVPFFKKVSGPAVISSCYCNAGFAELQDGNLDNAKKYFEQAKACGEEQLEEVEAYATSLAMLAELADHEGDITQAKALRAQAFALVQKMPDQTVVFACQATAIYACYLAMEGNPSHAREIITPAVTNASKQLSGRAVQCKYLAGMVELIDGEFEKSRAYFEDTIEDCISVAELKYRARSQRALGEILVVQGDLVGAKKHFDATAELCDTMGLPKHRLYSDLGCYAPNETFDGWTLYQEGHAMFRT